MANLVERLRAYDPKASLIDRLREHDLASYPEDGDWQDHYCDRADALLKEAATALEAEASEREPADVSLTMLGDGRFYDEEGGEWEMTQATYERRTQNCQCRRCVERRALIPEAPVREDCPS